MKEKINKLLLFSVFVIVLMIYIVFSINYYQKRKEYIKEEVKINSFLWGFDVLEENIKNEYELIIEISKLNIKKGIYNKEHQKNNVDQNIEILKDSSYPGLGGVTIILSHSGNTNVSYFKDLDLLTYKDTASLYYNNIKYTYEVVDSYYIIKDGFFHVSNDVKENSLILITCKKNSDEQLVVILNLLSKDNY